MESVSSPFSVQLGSFSDKTLLALTIPPASQAREMILLALLKIRTAISPTWTRSAEKVYCSKQALIKAGFGSRQTCLIVPCCTGYWHFQWKGLLPAWLERFRVLHLKSGGPMQYFKPRTPLSTGSCTAGTSANFIFLKCGFPLPFVCLVVVVVVFVFYYFLWSVKVIEKGDLRLVAFLWNDPDKELIWNHSDLYSQTRHTHMSNALVCVSSDCIMERSDH